MRLIPSYFAFVALLIVAFPPLEAQPPEFPPYGKFGYDSTATTFVNEAPYILDAHKYPSEFGVIRMPLDHQSPGTGWLALPYIRLLAEKETGQPPLVYCGDGPGFSNILLGRQLAAAGWDDFPYAAQLAERDVILLGYRGVDGSVRIDIPEVDPTLKQANPLADRQLAAAGDALDRGMRRLEGDGVVFEYFSLWHLVQDIDFLRKTLGYDQIQILGVGYGAQVAFHYAQSFSQHLDRLVLQSPRDPMERFPSPQALERVWRLYQGSWPGGDLTALFDSVFTSELPGNWHGYPLDPDKVRLMAYRQLKNPKTAVQLFSAFQAAKEKGDKAGLAYLSLNAVKIPDERNLGDVFLKYHLPPWNVEETPSPKSTVRIGRPFVDFFRGAVAASGRLPGLEKRTENPFGAYRKISAPTLALIGDHDVTTHPDETKQLLANYFPNSNLVIAKGFGFNDAIRRSGPAYNELLSDFLTDGQVNPAPIPPEELEWEPEATFQAQMRRGIQEFMTVAAVGIIIVVGVIYWISIRGKPVGSQAQ